MTSNSAPAKPSTPGILPSTARLLRGLRSTLQEIAQGTNALDDRTRLALRSADVVLNELLLRQSRAFLTELYTELRSLALEGATLLSEQGAAFNREVSALPAAIDDQQDFDVASQAVAAMLQLLDRQMQLLSEESEPARALAKRMIDAETRLYTYRVQQAAAVAAPARGDFTASAFQSYLQTRFPERGFTVKSFRELVGGFQKTTVLVTLEDRERKTEKIVIRAEKPEVFLRFDCSEVPSEFELVQVMHRAGVPVAEPLWVETNAAALGTRFMVSRELAGSNAGDSLGPRQLSDGEVRSVVQVLAQIHAVPLDERVRQSPVGHWLQHASLRDNTLALVRSWRDQLWVSRSNASLVASRMIRWLIDNVPKEEAPARLLHVDYGPHNLMFADGKVSGVLDWESVRIGDPAEDLSDLLGRFAGTIDRSKAIAWYREGGGEEISEYRLRYFDVFNNIKPVIASLSAGTMFEHEQGAPLQWCIMPLLYSTLGRDVDAKIAAVEALSGARAQR